MLDLLQSALPAGIEPAAVISCTPMAAHKDRMVLRVRTGEHSGAERTYTVKCYCDDLVERVWAFTRMLADHLDGANGDRVGLPIAYVKQEWTLVSPWIDGVPLTEVTPPERAGLLRRAASMVVRLHRLAVAPEPPTTAVMLIEETLDRRERLRDRWPDTLAVVDPLVDALQELSASLDPAEPAPVHGDLGNAQLLWAQTADRLVLFDWDRFGYADPAFDVGHFLAQLDRMAVLDPTVQALAPDWVSAFFDSYVEAMPQVSSRNVAFYRAMTLVWKIHTICRVQPAAWPQLVPQLAQAARAALQAAAAPTR